MAYKSRDPAIVCRGQSILIRRTAAVKLIDTKRLVLQVFTEDVSNANFFCAPKSGARREQEEYVNLNFGGRRWLMNKGCFLIPHADYVFVDEHNRHKRLKGMIFLWLISESLWLIFFHSDESL